MKDTFLKYFYIYFDTFQHIERLSFEERGKLFTALYKFAETGEVAELENPATEMAFSFMSAQIKRDRENYYEKAERQSRIGKLGGAPKGNQNARKDNRKTTQNNLNNPNNPEEEKEEEKEKEEEYNKIINSFNLICKSLPKVAKLTDKRKHEIIKAKKALGKNSFEFLFSKCERSDFLSGRKGGWNNCGFDWILKPPNIVKILEGTYDNKEADKIERNYSEEF